MMLAIFFVYFVLLALKVDYSTLLLTLKIVHREMNLDPIRKLPPVLSFQRAVQDAAGEETSVV